MTPSSWYLAAKDFAGPIATASAAGVAAYVAWSLQRRQADIAANKLRLDLFDRRFAVFTAASQLLAYGHSVCFSPETFDHRKSAEYRSKIEEAEFLLSGSTVKYLERCVKEFEGAVMRSRRKLYAHIPGVKAEEDTLTEDSAKLFELQSGLAAIFRSELTITG